jgi:hypothetical protein
MRQFLIADLNALGELKLQALYAYEQLERIPGALELIAPLSASLYAAPDEFEAGLPEEGSPVTLRWKSASASTGIGTIRCRGQLAAVSLLVSGIDREADHQTLAAFQQHLLRQLRGTAHEPAFSLMELPYRPLAATVNFLEPQDPVERLVVALADRCLAAAFFRRQGLA